MKDLHPIKETAMNENEDRGNGYKQTEDSSRVGPQRSRHVLAVGSCGAAVNKNCVILGWF